VFGFGGNWAIIQLKIKENQVRWYAWCEATMLMVICERPVLRDGSAA